MASKKPPRTPKEWRTDLRTFICVGLLLLGLGIFALANGGNAFFGAMLLAVGVGVVLLSTLKWTSLPAED